MVFDIVFPKNNEESFIEMGKKLGYNSLIFVYNSILDVPVNSFKFENKIGILCSPKDAKLIRSKGFLSVVDLSSVDNDVVLRQNDIDLVINLTSCGRKKYTHIRNSGLNQVLAKNLFDNNILVAEKIPSFDFSEFFGRCLQNFSLAKKYNFRIGFFSFALVPEEMSFSHDVCSFFVLCGLSKKYFLRNLSFDYF